jgi:hypothetical protein
VAYKTIELIIQHAVARAQRDDKVYLCHDIWNGSHAHLLVVTKDAQQCKQFYCEVQKKITDALKRLLGMSYLSLWEGRVTLALIGGLDKGIERVAYFYANPAQDDLETCIERFVRYTSFSDFLATKEKGILDKTSIEVPYIRLPSIPKVRSAALSPSTDRGIVRLLKIRNKQSHSLTRYPNIWMRSFGVEESDVPAINKRILEELRGKEKRAALRREKEGKKVMGRAKLSSQPILKEHAPKKKSRKIFYLDSVKERRIAYLKEFKDFCAHCTYCYQQWLLGDFSVAWPPGAFKPPLPPSQNFI